jgi:DNA-binding transcriptional LysR family regulator
MLREEVDISIRVISNPPQNLVARYLAPVRYVACASIDYAREHGVPAQLEELLEVPILTSGVAGRQLRLSAYKNEVRQALLIEPTLISENFQFLHEAILAGLGIGIVPDYVIEADVGAGRAVAALEEWTLSIFGTKMFMLYMPNRYHTRSTSTFIEYILERASI